MNITALLAGLLSGIIGSMGLGGGTVLIIYLSLFTSHSQLESQGINLLFFIPSALVAIFIRCKRSKLNWKAVLPAIAAGCVAAAVFSWISTVLDVKLLKKLFGAILITAGIRELFYRPRNAR